MTLEERYEFDLNGYIVYPEVLSREEVERINGILSDRTPATGSGKFAFFELDPLFMDLLARPQLLEILRVLLGNWLRFDHAFGIQMTRTSSIMENLHGGPVQEQRAFWYHWLPWPVDARPPGQTMHNGLIKVIYALNDVQPEDGGFICVPGSHKGNIAYRPRFDSHLVVNPTFKAGDALIFTEALVHGSRQWVSDRTRRVLIYSYAPGFLAWKNYEFIKHYLKFATTDVQRDLLRPPFVGSYDEHTLRPSGEWPVERRSKVRIPENNSSKTVEVVPKADGANRAVQT